MQLLNCVTICSLCFQTEVFYSYGYLKYVTQTDGSMDLLVKLAPLKAKSIAYKFNNLKIRKIISIQRKKESILKTVEQLKDKIKRWRQFTRTTLENPVRSNREEVPFEVKHLADDDHDRVNQDDTLQTEHEHKIAKEEEQDQRSD